MERKKLPISCCHLFVLGVGALYLIFLQRNTLVPVWDAVKITDNQGGLTAKLARNNFFGSSVCALGDCKLWILLI